MAERGEVYNPKWLQVILYIGIAGFPCLSAWFFFLAFQALFASELGGFFGCSFFGLGIGYISRIGLLLAKYVGARVEFEEEQFWVILGQSKIAYEWSDIKRAKNYESSAILRLFDSSGNTICVIDHASVGYSNFAAKLDEHISI